MPREARAVQYNSGNVQGGAAACNRVPPHGMSIDSATRPRARSAGGARGERMATTKGQSRRRKPSSPDDGPVAATARASTRSQAQKGPGRSTPSRNGAEPQALDTETTLNLYRKMN